MLTTILKNKNLKAKEQVLVLAENILLTKISINDVVSYALNAKDAEKANCVEALEFVTKQQPNCLTEDAFNFIVDSLNHKAPRIKWESAKIIGNTISYHQNQIEKALVHLLLNTEHEGTVVRWSAAFALTEIYKLNSVFNKDLKPAIEAIVLREEKNSIRKIYTKVLK